MGTSPDRDETALKQEARAVWPSLAYYYGIPPSEIKQMPRWERELYADALPALLASTQLRAIEAASFAHLDADAQKRIMDRYIDALPESSKAKPQMPKSKVDFMALGAAAGIGVVFEPKEKKDEPATEPSGEVTDA